MNVCYLYKRTFESPLAERWRQEQKALRKEARRVARSEAAAAARDQLQTIKTNNDKRVCSDAKYGEFPLPPTVLQRVMSCLAGIEADGVRGPSMAARDLANAALVSWDFYNAAKHGFAALEAQAAQLQLLPNSNPLNFNRPVKVQCSSHTLTQLPLLPKADGWSWQQWAALMQDPLRYKVAELKQAAKQLRVPRNRSKAELVVEILEAFGLQQPSSVAPQLLRAVLLERCCKCPWVGCEVLGRAWGALKTLPRSEVDSKWPGLSETLFTSSIVEVAPAAERRKALQVYTGTCSKQQLLQLQQEAQQRQMDICAAHVCEDVRREVLYAQQQEMCGMMHGLADHSSASSAWDAELREEARREAMHERQQEMRGMMHCLAARGGIASAMDAGECLLESLDGGCDSS